MSNKKEYKNLTIVLYIYNASTDELEATHTKNIDSHERRVWLNKTMMWALFNGKYVEIVNKQDDKPE